jgi:prepilin-type processing-associated H-X9-DG protein
MRPYLKNEGILIDPMNPVPKSQRENAGGAFPYMNAPVAFREQQRQLNMAFTADWGVNSQYWNPIWVVSGQIVHKGIAQDYAQDLGNTVMAVSSIWDRNGQSPVGGGNYGVDAPCIFDQQNRDTRPDKPSATAGYYWWGGWNPSSPNAWNVFGGVWPWHGTQVIVAWGDGHAKTMALTQITRGCDVRDAWAGRILDKQQYYWDLE